jgi:glycosyltransferase involved in cell wall biosynthesis
VNASLRILLTVDPEIPVPPRLYGGIERIVDGIAAELRLRGHSVGLVAHPKSTCPVERLFPWPGAVSGNLRDGLMNTRALGAAVRLFRPDLVHSFSRLAYLLPLLARRVPAIMSYQRQTGGRKLRIAQAIGGRTFQFTTISEYIAAMGRNGGGRWSVIPNFADTGYYRFVQEVPPDAPLVFLSRVERIKGAHTAIAIARQSGRRLVIAGNQVDTAEGREYWRTEIEPRLEPGKVEYVGAVDDARKNALLGAAAALLVPIEWGEPFGIVFAEALACGTPVISCPRGSLPEIVRPGIDGFLIRSIEEGCEAVGKLGTIDRAGCRRRAEQEYAPEVVVLRYVDVYERARTALAARR